MARDIRNMPLSQSDAYYNQTLLELKRRATEGTPLYAYDDTSPGCKSTGCSLGLCDEALEQGSDGVYRRDHHFCPHDARYFTETGEPTGAEEDLNGCFYTCRIFQEQSTQEAAVARILAVPLINPALSASTPEDV